MKLEDKIAEGVKDPNPEKAFYWAHRLSPRKKSTLQRIAGRRVQIVSEPHSDIRNGKKFTSGGQGPATRVYL